MNNHKIYWTSIEYKYSEQSPEFRKLTGGFVYGFVKASDEKEALNKFIDELEQRDINVKEVEFLSLYDTKMEWEKEEQTNNFLEHYKEAQSCNEVFFDTFYAYETNEE